MEKILEVKHLKKIFKSGKEFKNVLNDINFTLNAGECLGVVGQSGCGKSTLAKIISRLLNADEGEVILCGKNITRAEGQDLKSAYSEMQMIFQMPEESVNPRKTLGWSIGEPLRNHNFENVDERIETLLREVGLTAEFINRYPHEVSCGQCQRAAIARAISLSPKLLICDEATSALDVTVQAQIIKLLRKLCTEKKIAMLFITHDLALLPKIADKVMVMHGGKIVEEGAPTEVIENSKSSFTKDLMATDFFTMAKI